MQFVAAFAVPAQETPASAIKINFHSLLIVSLSIFRAASVLIEARTFAHHIFSTMIEKFSHSVASLHIFPVRSPRRLLESGAARPKPRGQMIAVADVVIAHARERLPSARHSETSVSRISSRDGT
jgi:hypothetical protein